MSGSPNKTNYYHLLKQRYFSLRKLLYPNRPIFTAILGLAFVGLGYLSLLPINIAIWLGITTMLDDVIITPVINMTKLFSNLFHSHKTTKSSFTVLLILSGYVLGGILGYFVLVNIPVFMSIVTAVESAYGTSVVAVLLAAGSAVGISKIFHLNPILWVGVALLLITFVPIPALVTPTVDLVATAIILGAFTSAIISKQLLRLAYFVIYGHSNADGYYYNHSKSESPTEIDIRQSKVFFGQDATLSDAKKIRDLRIGLINTITSIKKETSFVADLFGFRQHNTYAYKDILRLLVTAKTPQEVVDLKAILSPKTKNIVSFPSYDSTFGGTYAIYNQATDSINTLLVDNPGSAVMAAMSLQANLFSHNKTGYKVKNLTHDVFLQGGSTICENGNQTSQDAIRFFSQSRSNFLDRTHTVEIKKSTTPVVDFN